MEAAASNSLGSLAYLRTSQEFPSLGLRAAEEEMATVAGRVALCNGGHSMCRAG